MFNDPLPHRDTGNLSAFRPTLCVSWFLVKLVAALGAIDWFRISAAMARLCSPFRKGHVLVLSSENVVLHMACDVAGSMYVASGQQYAGLEFGEEQVPLQLDVHFFYGCCGWPTL